MVTAKPPLKRRALEDFLATIDGSGNRFRIAHHLLDKMTTDKTYVPDPQQMYDLYEGSWKAEEAAKESEQRLALSTKVQHATRNHAILEKELKAKELCFQQIE